MCAYAPCPEDGRPLSLETKTTPVETLLSVRFPEAGGLGRNAQLRGSSRHRVAGYIHEVPCSVNLLSWRATRVTLIRDTHVSERCCQVLETCVRSKQWWAAVVGQRPAGGSGVVGPGVGGSK